MAPSRREFLKASGVGLSAATASSLGKEADDPLLSFGLMADCQYVNAPNGGSRHYNKGPKKLREAVEAFNRQSLTFVTHLGDFIDRDFASFDDLLPITKELKAPLHHVLGNHDFDMPDADKPKVPAKLGLKKTYYSLSKNGARFIFLDTTEHSTYRHAAGSPGRAAAAAELDALKTAKANNARPWNSRPGDTQIEWLEAQLAAATKASEMVLVFGHHPIRPVTGLSMWRADRVHKLFVEHPCVKAYLNGHEHKGDYAEVEGVHYLTLQGMVELDTNAYSFGRLFADRLEVEGLGRQTSRTLAFR